MASAMEATTTTMEAATATVEAAATAMEATTTAVEAAAIPMEATATTVEAAAYETTASTPSAVVSMPAAVISAPAAVVSMPAAAISAPVAMIITPSAAIAIATPATTVPGAGAEEEPAIEPLRAVVSIGRAGVGRVSVVAVLAYWWAVRIIVAEIDAKRNLSVRCRRRHQDEPNNCKQCEMFETTHGGTPLLAPPKCDVAYGAG